MPAPPTARSPKVPPDKKKPPAGDRRLSKGVLLGGFDTSDHSLSIPVSQLRPRPVRPDELPDLRAIFWRQARLGHRLPAEAEIIVIEGGRV